MPIISFLSITGRATLLALQLHAPVLECILAEASSAGENVEVCTEELVIPVHILLSPQIEA